MRNSSKKIASAVIAITMVASMSVTAFAADYGVVIPVSSSASSTTPVTEEAVESAIEEAIGASDSESADSKEDASKVATVTIASTKNLSVKPSILKTLAKSENTVLEYVAPKATISIDSSTIKKARKIDLTMQVVNSKSKTTIDMRSKKSFGCEVKITLTKCKMSKAKLKAAHVYCDGEDLGPVELDENGNPVITVTKGGEYTIK